jgi:triacylglycerol lipase
MFNNQNPDPLRPEPAGIPEGYELGAWIHMTDFLFGLKEPKFYGIVAHGIEDPDSRVIAIRGTEAAIEWMDDAAVLPVPFRQVPDAGRVAYGFDKVYSSLKVVKYKTPRERLMPAPAVSGAAPAPETYSGSFAEQLEQLAQSRETTRSIAPAERGVRERVRRPTVVTGHSLGSALATLFVMENDTRRKFDIGTLCTFASPRVGNLDFARRFDQLPLNSWRIVNSLDLVPKMPPHIPIVLEYDHVETAYPFRSSDFAKNSMECWHSMNTYLHWLDDTYPLLPQCTAKTASAH